MDNTTKDDTLDQEEQGIDVFELLDGNPALKNVKFAVKTDTRVKRFLTLLKIAQAKNSAPLMEYLTKHLEKRPELREYVQKPLQKALAEFQPGAEICSNLACKKIILGHSHYVWTYPFCCECFDEWAVETVLSINSW